MDEGHANRQASRGVRGLSKAVTRVLDTPDDARERWARDDLLDTVRRRPARRWALVLGMATTLAAACGGGSSACGGSTNPCPGGGDVALAAGQFALYAGTQVAGALAFPAAGAGGAQYLVVAQFATGHRRA